jgi:hypothetical protein
MTFQAHPMIDALEARLLTNVTLSTRHLNGQRKFVVEAHSNRTSYGNTALQAINRFCFNNKIEL